MWRPGRDWGGWRQRDSDLVDEFQGMGVLELQYFPRLRRSR